MSSAPLQLEYHGALDKGSVTQPLIITANQIADGWSVRISGYGSRDPKRFEMPAQAGDLKAQQQAIVEICTKKLGRLRKVRLTGSWHIGQAT